jgi:hypothetical protein
MSAQDVSAIIAGAGFLLSLLVSSATIGIIYASLRARVTALEASRNDLATKDQVQGLSVQVAELRGMFTLAPKQEQKS